MYGIKRFEFFFLLFLQILYPISSLVLEEIFYWQLYCTTYRVSHFRGFQIFIKGQMSNGFIEIKSSFSDNYVKYVLTCGKIKKVPLSGKMRVKKYFSAKVGQMFKKLIC